MKAKILFVDDESNVLEGLRRMLRHMREEWEMEFVEGGRQALELMEQKPFDVVVADMRMPGMNGAELLNEVMKRHPTTVRFILSGHADQELIMKCIGSTHQYLSKPCDPEDLKSAVLRATSINSLARNERIKQLVSRMDRLPSIPSLYIEIIEKLQSMESSIDDVADIISKDMAMTAKILKLVNSAFFGLARRVSSPNEAVNYLGMDMIKSLVLAAHVFSQFEALGSVRFHPEYLWNHSLETAATAKKIAKIEHGNCHFMDECFVAGMLHDSGKLVLASNFPQDYDRALERAESGECSYLDAEREVFEVDHAEIGGYLLSLWGLPEPVVEAIMLHHRPGQSFASKFTPLAAVHIANALVHEYEELSGDPFGVNGLDPEFLKTLNLSDHLEQWRKAAGGEMEKEFET